MTDAERPLPLVLQEHLSELLDRARRVPELAAEMERARRDFFDGELPRTAHSDQDLDLAAQRFAEWFLLERESDAFGIVPIERLAAAGDDDPCEQLRDSVVGIFLVEGRGESLRVRDLQGGDRLAVRSVVGEVRPGDLLVGRLYGMDDEFVPSAAAAVIGGAPQLAVAFQRDLKQLELQRRLDQAELERLVVQRLDDGTGPGPALRDPADDRPIEHLEAELQQLLAEVGKDEELPPTRLSGALRAAEGPGEVLGPVLEELAFDTQIDLEKVRDVMLRLWNAHHTTSAGIEPVREPLDATPPSEPAPQHLPADGASPPFHTRPGESLGEQLARRIEEGLAAEENVEKLFEQVEAMMGDAIDDDDEDDRFEDLADGNLDPLVREFAWETGLSADDESRMQSFLSQLRELPVPRVDAESIEADDILRWFLHVWLSHAPGARQPQLQAVDSLLGSFVRWLAETQEITVGDDLAIARQALVSQAERIDRASGQLSGGAVDPAAQRGLLKVIDLIEDVLVAADAARSTEIEVRAGVDAVRDLERGDLLIAAYRPGETGTPVGFHGPVVVLPKDVEHLVSG